MTDLLQIIQSEAKRLETYGDAAQQIKRKCTKRPQYATLNDRFEEDLGIDSLARVMLFIEIGQKLEVDIPDDEFMKVIYSLKTGQQVLDYVNDLKKGTRQVQSNA